MEGKKCVNGPQPVNDKCVSHPRRARISVSLSELHEGHTCTGIVINFRVGMSELTETLEEMDDWKNESDLCLWVKTRNWPEGELDGTFFTWGAAVFKPTTILLCT